VTRAQRDIETRADLRAFMDEFYARLLADPRISALFVTLDLDVHLPILVDFWAMMLLGEGSYRRNAFEKHVPLAIEEHHFGVWLGHFDATLDELFTGERSELAKSRARSIAAMFRSKLSSMGRLSASPRENAP
jgi:hemoglobin